MLVCIFLDIVALIMLSVIIKNLKRYNINDIILGLSFLMALFIIFGGAVIYYNYKYYPYYEDILEEVKQIEINSDKPVVEFKVTYGYYDKNGNIEEIKKKNADVYISEEVIPHIKVYRVIRKYNVEENTLFNIMIAFRFEDYSIELDEYFYEIYSNSISAIK